MKVGVAVADIFTGLYATIAILGALVLAKPPVPFEEIVLVHPVGALVYFLLKAGTAPAREMICPACLLVRTQSKNFSTVRLAPLVGKTPQM